MLAPTIGAALSLTLTAAAFGQFTTYQGNATVEASWRSAVVSRFGSTSPMESFESYVGTLAGGTSDQIISLPALGVVFDSAIPGAYPGVYAYAPQAHTGTNQLANFGGGLGQFADYNMKPAPGRAIYAVGLWQCDPQGNLTVQAYDHLGELVGTMVAQVNIGDGNSFAAFISTTPIARVLVLGAEGDGWNHLDDLQVTTRPLTGAQCSGDIGVQGGLPGSDGVLDNNDFVVFIDFFFTGSPAADRGVQGGVSGIDGVFDNNDFIVFIDQFFAGC